MRATRCSAPYNTAHQAGRPPGGVPQGVIIMHQQVLAEPSTPTSLTQQQTATPPGNLAHALPGWPAGASPEQAERALVLSASMAAQRAAAEAALSAARAAQAAAAAAAAVAAAAAAASEGTAGAGVPASSPARPKEPLREAETRAPPAAAAAHVAESPCKQRHGNDAEPQPAAAAGSTKAAAAGSSSSSRSLHDALMAVAAAGAGRRLSSSGDVNDPNTTEPADTSWVQEYALPGAGEDQDSALAD